ncbi:hypothetical protein NQ315_001902 [Exocentrus adspersus]|uniref:Serine/threonine-protein kinase RIO3 n=1 Tax=Exocentrus adspersus TaxID=1586481 RepID=A0AAV8WA00_9CUCU|nr:hypothetical protein NQ315_001902 [Exocentrus adspersus]
MSCPWANIEKPEPVNFSDIMAEEIAKDIQAKEELKMLQTFEIVNQSTVGDAVSASKAVHAIPLKNTDNSDGDEITVQIQFNEEYTHLSKRMEDKFCSKDLESDLDEEEVNDILDQKKVSKPNSIQIEIASVPILRGYKTRKVIDVITENDVVLVGKGNICKLPSFLSDFKLFDLKLSKKILNSLNLYFQNEFAGSNKIQEQAAAEFTLDQHTRLLLYRMTISRLIQDVSGVVCVGKDAILLHATLDPSYPKATKDWPSECVIKVFKTTCSKFFKEQPKYIKEDSRLRHKYVKVTTGKTIQFWSKREVGNLSRLKIAGIPCPQVLQAKQHVVVMSFIGKNGRRAPRLADTRLSREEYASAYEQVRNSMKMLFEKVNLIHGDLSENNILWHDGLCYFIDVNQSVEPSHDKAFRYLFKDCTNIIKFFGKKLVKVETPEQLFEFVTGYSYNNRVAFASLQLSVKMKSLHRRKETVSE